jgi:hypothetical protein
MHLNKIFGDSSCNQLFGLCGPMQSRNTSTSTPKNIDVSHLDGSLIIKTWNEKIYFFMVLDSNPVIVHMMIIGNLRDRELQGP